MKKEGKIHLFRDRDDYIKKITDDDIFNVTGEKGAGKSFLGNMKDMDKDFVVIHLDPVFQPLGNSEHLFSSEVRQQLIEKFGNKLLSSDFEEKHYPVIITYLKNKKKTSYVEGGSIADIQDISTIVGTVIVKRTSVLKCFFRTVKRDYANEYFMDLEIKKHGKLAKITRLYNVIKRRKKILKSYHEIEKFIDRVENFEVK